MTPFLSNTDAFAWAMEADPNLRSTIVVLVLLDRTPEWPQVLERFDHLSRELPLLRRRVVESPPPVPPRWEDDPNFDIGYHLRRVSAPAPGNLAALLEMARIAAMADFDRDRPLWEITVVDGLADGGAALLCKVHHSLTNGIGGVQIGLFLFDRDRTPRDRGPMPAEPEPTRPDALDQARQTVGLLGNAVGTTVKSLTGAVLDAVRRPMRAAVEAVEVAASVYRTVRPIAAPGSPLMTERKPVRTLGVHEVPLPALRGAGHAAGGSLNAAFLGAITSGLRRYHEKHGVSVERLYVTMPISLRTEEDDLGGNRITLMRFAVPADIEDPTLRIREIHRLAAQKRAEKSIPYTQWIAGAMNVVPRAYIGSVLRNVDFVATDVPGFLIPVFFAGAEVRSVFAFAPTIGAAVNFSLFSYAQSCQIGINADSAAVPDFDVFHDALVAGFDEVLALAD